MKNLFRNSFRIVNTHGILYSRDQMENMRLRAIYNASGIPEYLDEDFVNRFYLENIRNGEYGLVEMISKLNNTNILSLLVFEDTWSRNVYAIRHWKIYKDKMYLVDLMN